MTPHAKHPAFKVSDLLWYVAIGLVLAGSGIWQTLSPRPEIGKVAVLWIPSAVLLVAVIRNWGRLVFCTLAIITFYGVGMISSFDNGSSVSSFLLLSADIAEVGLIAWVLTRWSGSEFKMTSPLTVAVFGLTTTGVCFLTSFLAASISQLPLETMPIVKSAPLQVGVAWFTSNLATYFLVGAPLLALTGREGAGQLDALKQAPVPLAIGALLVMALTFIGFVGPQILAEKTGLALGSGGLILVAFPLASYLAIRRGPTIAALVGAAIGIPTLYATVAGLGPFGKGNVAANVFDMQATLIVTMFTLLLIGAMAEQLRDRARALERALDEAMTLRHDLN
jgi:hypothetical protein